MNAPPTDDDLAELETVLERLVAEWREARSATGLTRGAPWSQIAAKLGIDRGSAQRLVRMGRLGQAAADDLEHVPGPRGWQRVLEGLERILGRDHAAHRRLALACEHYGERLAALGGSKAAALRAISSRGPDPALDTRAREQARARERWFEAAAESMGYQIELRQNLRLVRPSCEEPGRLDIAMVHAFLGCSGHRGALPFALTRYSTRDGVTPESGSRDPHATDFVLLETATSTPPPSLLSTGDNERKTVFIEPTWSEADDPLDVSILQVERGAMADPRHDPPPLLVLSTLVTHPARCLVMQTLLAEELIEDSVARFASYRDLALHGQTRHWFDRLPEAARLKSQNHGLAAATVDRFPRHGEFVAEVTTRLGWDLSGFRGHQITVDHPVPLSRCSIEYELQPS